MAIHNSRGLNRIRLFESKLPAEMKGQAIALESAFNKIPSTVVRVTTSGNMPKAPHKRISDTRNVYQTGLRNEIGPVYDRTRVYDVMARDNIARPSIILPLKLRGNTREDLPGTVREPVFKKGGKVVKYQYPAGNIVGQAIVGDSWNKPKFDNNFSIRALGPSVKFGDHGFDPTTGKSYQKIGDN